jgi:hypothetical protein
MKLPPHKLMHTMILAALLLCPGSTQISWPAPLWLNDLRIERGLDPVPAPMTGHAFLPRVSTAAKGFFSPLTFKGIDIFHSPPRKLRKEDVAYGQAYRAENERYDALLDSDDFRTANSRCKMPLVASTSFPREDYLIASTLAGDEQGSFDALVKGLSPWKASDFDALWVSLVYAKSGKLCSGQSQYVKDLLDIRLGVSPSLKYLRDAVLDDPKGIAVASVLLLAEKADGGRSRALFREALKLDPGNKLTEYLYCADYSGPMSLREEHLKALLPLVPEGEVKEGYRKQLAYYHQKAMEETPTP